MRDFIADNVKVRYCHMCKNRFITDQVEYHTPIQCPYCDKILGLYNMLVEMVIATNHLKYFAEGINAMIRTIDPEDASRAYTRGMLTLFSDFTQGTCKILYKRLEDIGFEESKMTDRFMKQFRHIKILTFENGDNMIGRILKFEDQE